MAGKHVLVIDDELAMQDVLAALLDALGHTAQFASSGAEAVSKIEATDFDLFFVDFHMPGMMGDQLALEIKRRKPGVPVVLMTGARPQHVFPGIDRVLLKPFTLAQLQDTISSLS